MDWIIIIFTYVSFILVWFVINLVAYFLSVALSRPSVMHTIAGLSQLVTFLLNFIIGIVLLWYGVTLLLNGQILWLLVYFFAGMYLITWILNILQLPFAMIPLLFSEKINSVDFKEDVATAELIDKDGNVIETIEGDTTISRRLALYFVAFYILNLIGIYFYPNEGVVYLWGDYIVTPFLQIIGGSVIFGLPYGVYRKLKYGSFFTEDKRLFLISVWKACLYFIAAISVITFLLA